MSDPDGAADPPTTGPRAPLRDLGPYLRPHWRVLVVVIAVSLVGAALFLAQPAVVSSIIARVSEERPLRGVVLLLSGLLVGGAVLSGVQQYLLQPAATANHDPAPAPAADPGVRHATDR